MLPGPDATANVTGFPDAPPVARNPTAAAVFYAVSSHVEDLAKDSVHPVFLLDEAHLLHQDTLNHLHILLNYQWDSRALLSLVLVGLPELANRLAMQRLDPIADRGNHALHLMVLAAGQRQAALAGQPAARQRGSRRCSSVS